MPVKTHGGALAKEDNIQDASIDATLSTGGITIWYKGVADAANVDSQTIVTTKLCLIVIVALHLETNSTQKTMIKRGGVDKTTLTTISALKFAWATGYGHLQYATELLPAGSYQYDLVNTSGGVLNVYGHAMQIVTVSA